MEFIVSKTDLVRELNLSQGVVEKRTTIPILSNILVEAGGDAITLTATDLELGIRCRCPAQVKHGGTGTIPARRLLDYVRLLPAADIQVKFTENHWVNLVCGRSRTRIAGMSGESFPELPKPPEPIAEIPAALLATMIEKTIFAISSEESRFTLTGALVVLKQDQIALVTTDGHRLAYIERAAEFPVAGSHRTLLPKKAMSEILKLTLECGPEAKIAFGTSENHLFFQFGERLLLSRKLTGNFPDYNRVLPKEHSHRIRLPREEFRAAIERVAQFSDERSHAIRVQVRPAELVVHSSISETGESEETLPVEYDGPEVTIGFNAQYMLDFLRAVGEQEVNFCFKDAGAAGEFRPDGDSKGEYRYVLMPMRI